MSIGVYDSGIGGLSVYHAIASKFKDLDMIYLGDSARVPYGNKSPETIIKYSIECAKYLASRYELSAFVVACNTVSSHAIQALEDALHIPVLGVIEPGARHACDITKNNKICILGTHATVNSGSYIRAIKKVAPNKHFEIIQQACPLFVPLAEEGLITGTIAETVVSETLKEISKQAPDTIILGCTHYPVLKELIQKSFLNSKIVDSTEYIINDIKNLQINLNENGERKIFVTDESHAFGTLKNLLAGNTPVEKINIKE